MTGNLQAPAPLVDGATLSDQVTEVLRQNVVNGVWSVGEVLPSESTLAGYFDVSRTVIREAVARLKAEGMLSSRQGRGAFVESNRPRQGFAISERDMESQRKLEQILELRMGLEIEAAAIAAARATPEAREGIQRAADAYGRAIRGAGPAVDTGVNADLAFHRAVCEATGNSYYLSLFNYLGASLRETMLAGRLQAIKVGGESRDAVQEHHAVAAAIAKGDAESARQRMRDHLQMSSARLLARFKMKDGLSG
ncbi:FadR family transcriptional regulator [Pseudooceanicola lipolyticus]|uniref:FadR family transcriptional regulator n=1 Tax=Pseudooceanicola lipolyticus TaxID=2029104 RepID=A0A2M8J5C7_9RHOB|nr:FadR/GntR family transcriptional regulator [Pseudooceanicola lipolyticus]PJE37973.1 FadR family transcriptional regulator [Pseudooceanicola lipolyticus]